MILLSTQAAWTRRQFLGAGIVGAGIAAIGGPRVPSMPFPTPAIHTRAEWGGDLFPVGPLAAEAPEDVRFLLVHHTASTNRYTAADVVPTLRGIYGFHTGEKGWPDVAYNFFVDREGGIWEGRTGSLTAPVKGDATGGSQGYALLCCFLGDHTYEPPTDVAVSSMASLLAWLGDRYSIDTRPGVTVSFISRGSNKWPAGSSVTTRTIAGHRDMSATACPGDAAYALVSESLPTAVEFLRDSLEESPVWQDAADVPVRRQRAAKSASDGGVGWVPLGGVGIAASLGIATIGWVFRRRRSSSRRAEGQS